MTDLKQIWGDKYKEYIFSDEENIISMNHVLFLQMNGEDWERVKNQMQVDLKNYYVDMGGV